MAQPIIMQSRGFRVVSGLLVCITLLMLLPGAGALPSAQAQEPDVSAQLSSVTRSVSGQVTFSTPCYNFSGTRVIPLSATVLINQSVQVKAGSGGAIVRLKMTVSLNSSVPINIYIGAPGCSGGSSSSSSALMSGSKVVTTSTAVYIPYNENGEPATLSVSADVPVTGSTSVNVSGTAGVYVWALNQPIYGSATIELLVDSGSATFPMYTYLPVISRSDIVFYDDFSTDRGWINLSSEDCEVTLDSGTLRVKIGKSGICWISAPSGVSLAQGQFSVRASRRSDTKGWYGLVFNATTKLLDQRWQFEAAPWDASDGCESGKGKLKLSYIDDEAGNAWTTCTSALMRNKNDWNELKVVRSGSNVKAYINNQEKFNVDDSHLSSAGLFDLVVWTEDSKGVEVRFDDFTVRY
ncbi:MAG: hypothetical protein ACUVSJ_07985 [Anaerolineae bacterium]